MNKMKLYTIIGAGLFALTSTTLLACSEIEDGSNDMSSWPEVKDYVTTLEHPCMLHTETDFEFVKGKVQAGNLGKMRSIILVVVGIACHNQIIRLLR